MSEFEQIVAAYGYWAIAGWVLLEGETPLILGGAFANRDTLHFGVVFAIAFAVTFAADQGFFHACRHGGRAWLEKRPKLQPIADRVAVWIGRYPNLIAIGFRFLYGMRSVALVLIGASGFSPRKFFVLNAIGTALWVTAYAGAGYIFGAAAERAFARLGQQAWWIFCGLAGLIIALVLWKKFKRRRNVASAPASLE